MEVHIGEVYAKQTTSKLVMYNVLKVKRSVVTLQNIDNPLSLFDITAQKLSRSGYVRVSQKPYIDTSAKKAKTKRSKALQKPMTKALSGPSSLTTWPTPEFTTTPRVLKSGNRPRARSMALSVRWEQAELWPGSV